MAEKKVPLSNPHKSANQKDNESWISKFKVNWQNKKKSTRVIIILIAVAVLSIAGILISYLAVSYTHLDVYKRQWLPASMNLPWL